MSRFGTISRSGLMTTVWSATQGAHGRRGTVATPATLLAQMPTGTIGLWTMDKYAATPRPTVVNQAAATAVSPNLLPTSRRQLGSGFPWGNNGCTIVNGVISPIDSTNNASTVVWGAGDNYLNFNGFTLASQVTLSFDAQTTDATTVSVRTGSNSALATISVTPTMQRFSTTFSNVGTPPIILVRSLNSSTPANLKIDNVTIHAGSVDLGRDTLAGHMMFGQATGFDHIPTNGTSGLLNFSAGAGGVIQFLNGQNLAAFTFIAIGSRPALTSYVQIQTPVSGFAGNYSNFSPAMDGGGANGGGYSEYIGGSQPIASTNPGLAWPRVNELHGIAHRYGDGFSTIFEDDIKARSVASTGLNAGSIGDLFISWVSNTGIYSRYSYAAMAMWPRALSDAEVVTAYNALKSYCTTTSALSINPATKWVTADGDSITAGVGSNDGLYSYADRAAQNLTLTVGAEVAVAGSTLGTSGDAPGTSSLYGRKAANLAMIPANKNGRKFCLTILIGRNDGPGWGTATAYATAIGVYAGLMKAGGYDKVLLCTSLPSTAAGYNAWRATLNSTIKGGGWAASNNVDAICDFDAVTGMGADADASNASNYGDGTHPTNAGYILLEPTYRTAVNAL